MYGKEQREKLREKENYLRKEKGKLILFFRSRFFCFAF